MKAFRVGISNDFAPGKLVGGWIDEPIQAFLGDLPGLEWEFLPPSESHVISSDTVTELDAVITGDYKWTPDSFEGLERLMLVASWGIGVDGIDLSTATERDVGVTNSPSPGNHASVAESALTLVLALSKRLLAKDGLTKKGLAYEAQAIRGTLVQNRTVGVIGLGHTARAFIQMLQPLRPARVLVHDPYVSTEVASNLGVELSDIDMVMEQSDYVVVMCTLSAETRGLINAQLLSRMKATACLVNTARGPIVDQVALVRMLREGAIFGAGLDVTDPEPPKEDDAILGLENVITTGHALAWTEESLRGACEYPCRAVASAFKGDLPDHVVNSEVISREGFQEKLARRTAEVSRTRAPS